MKKYRSFKEARKFILSQGIHSMPEWKKFYKSNKRPDDIPTSPDMIYKKEWKGWSYWFDRETLSFSEARKFVHSLKLKDQKAWREYCTSGKKPRNIRANPQRTYKKEWNDMGDWLGTNYIFTGKREYRSFKESKKFVKKIGIKNYSEWIKYCKSGKKPADIPSGVTNVYKKEWKGYGDFLGTNVQGTREREYRSYTAAKKYVHTLKIASAQKWLKFTKLNKLPLDIPNAPENVYKKEWKSWGDFLGTGSLPTQKIRQFMLSYDEAEKQARILCKKLNINNSKEWEKAWMQGKIPKNIPKKPWDFYSKRRQNRKRT